MDSTPPFPLVTKGTFTQNVEEHMSAHERAHTHTHASTHERTHTHLVFAAESLVAQFTRRENKMERHAGVEDWHPPGKSTVSPRNNTGDERRANGEQERSDRERVVRRERREEKLESWKKMRRIFASSNLKRVDC